ncbi:MAG: hypothetical protein JWQ81_8495 [Amycolatopsis sp.]|nr:hypothetical protein [Amycolatopsis sp.]
MAAHTRPKGRVCSHRRYRLDCAAYDALVEYAGARCQICRRSGPETGHGYLVVDHDPMVGWGAVRGLLCNRCNLQISYDRLPADQTRAYLADPWYARPGPKTKETPDA